MKKLIQDIIFAWRYKRAVKDAVRLQKQTGRKYFVININGKPSVISKQAVSKMVSTHKFKKGVKTASIEKMALFVTR